MKSKPNNKKVSTVTISRADLSWAIDACSPSVLDGVGNALFQKLWRKLGMAQGKFQFERTILVRKK